MRHIFFDLDRTLWDFEKNSETALQILYDRFLLGEYFRSFRAFHKTYKEINASMWYKYGKGEISKETLRSERFLNTLKIHNIDNEELANHIGLEYLHLSPYQTNLLPGAIETLEDLRKSGFRMHIITNGFKEIQYIKLEKSGLLPYFDIIVCSEEVGKTKPSKDVFHFALNKAGALSKNSIMVGDDYFIDIQGAENAGMHGILFDPQNTYRYGTHQWKVKNLSDIPELLPWVFKPTH